MADETELKKERHRSPNYPAVGLADALDRVSKLVRANGKAGAPTEVAAKNIGYSSAHGSAMSTMAALKKFGLVTDNGGRIVPTQRALEIINLPDGDPRRKIALQEAALSPSIYRELVTFYKDTGLPGAEALEAELKTYKGFNPKAVAAFVRDFLSTLDFAGINVTEGIESGSSDSEKGESQGKMEANTSVPKEIPPAIVDFSSFFKGPMSRKYPLDISIARGLKAELSISGDFKQADLQRLKTQINRLIENLEDAFSD
jgi:hypothetical protein